MENYKIIEGSKSATGEEIKLHDICRSVSTNEILIVVKAVNHHHKLKGLAVENKVTGASDWLSIYPDGELEVIANLNQ
ncbi:hypothetical protein [Kurthia gibsonii]|uniref:hypothetical protein n=1 Tax=Kurthia gibsonii TaxID=33946 RepID=UPI0030159E62